MVLLGMIGPWQIILLVTLVIILPIGIYLIGYRAGKKAGYIQRIKELEKKGN